MDIKILISELTLEYIPQPYKKYAESIGIENLFKLAEKAGGKNIYLPKPQAILKNLIRHKIVEDYKTGKYTVNELSDKYEISFKTVLKYIHE